MTILAPDQANNYYNEIFEIHSNRGNQPIEQKVIEYKGLLDRTMANIEGVDRKTGGQLKGYDFVKSEVRSAENPQGTVSQILWNRIKTVMAFRNDIYHEKIPIEDYDDYRMCVKAMAKTVEYFSDVPIPEEIVDVYSTGNFPDLSQKAPSTPGGNTPRSAEAIPDGLLCVKAQKGVIITGYTGKETSLVIPPVIESKDVIGIGPRAFAENEILQRIKLPETLETIDDEAFYNCTSLQQIDLPEKITTIGEYAFAHCASLQQFDFPKGKFGPVTMKYSAIEGCKNLRTVSLPENWKSISITPEIFDSCDNLTFIYLSSQTEIIGSFPPDVKLIYLD